MPRSISRLCLAAFALLAVATPTLAAPPLDPAERRAVAGDPTAIEIAPATVILAGVHDARQLVVTGKYADGSVRDLTAVAAAKVEPADIVAVQDGLFLRPRKNGAASLVVTAGGKEARVSVTVAGMDQPTPTSFRR